MSSPPHVPHPAAHSHATHDHAHDDRAHGAHAHGVTAPTEAAADPRARRLLWAFALTTLTLVAEAVGGWMSGSLALLADAGHMLIDALALLFAWLGAYYARRPADALRSFGYARLEVLVGYSNALAQFLLVIWIVGEAAMRFVSPAPILTGLMLVVALIGLAINGLVLSVLGGHDHDDVNSAGAHLHVLGDLLGSAGAVAAALLMRYFAWTWADPVVSVLVSLLILRSAWSLLRRSAHILLEGVPEGVEAASLGTAIEREAAGVYDVHHVHVWQLAGGNRVATLHARIADGIVADAAMQAVRRVLRERFGIAHVTIQLETTRCADADCKPAPPVPLGDHCGHAH